MKDELYYRYAVGVLDGSIVAGEYIKLACKRFLKDLEREDLYFDKEKVDRVIKFIGLMKHSTGKHAGQQFNLIHWQAFIVANVYGLYWKKTGLRKYTSVYVEVSRKSGKSTFAAGLGLLHLVADGEPNAQVICAANSRDQARILLESATQLAKSIDPDGDYLDTYRQEIRYKDNLLKIVSAQTNKLDGLNCSCFIIDELHEAKSSAMFDVLRSSQGMREQPLAITITTAGFDKSSYCYSKRNVCIDILKGIKEDETQFAAIYSLDADDDWTDESNWIKAAPNLGITTSYQYLRDSVNTAKNSPSEEVGVKTKLLNIWCDSAKTWLSSAHITNCIGSVSLEDYRGYTAFVGVDLSATNDLTAVSYMIVDDDKHIFKTFYYLPEMSLVDGLNKEQYKLWHNTGQLKITEGEVVDYDYITQDIYKASQILNIQSIGYDKWNSTQWAINSVALGLPLQEFSQSIGNFNIPTKEMERIIISKRAVIDSNDITRYCFANVKLKQDHNGNIKPSKEDRYKKIDGVIAMIQALGIYLITPRFSNEILTF